MSHEKEEIEQDATALASTIHTHQLTIEELENELIIFAHNVRHLTKGELNRHIFGMKQRFATDLKDQGAKIVCDVIGTVIDERMNPTDEEMVKILKRVSTRSRYPMKPEFEDEGE